MSAVVMSFLFCVITTEVLSRGIYYKLENIEGQSVQCQIEHFRYPMSVWYKGRNSTNFIKILRVEDEDQRRNLSHQRINFDDHQNIHLDYLRSSDKGEYKVIADSPEETVLHMDVNVIRFPTKKGDARDYPQTSTDPAPASSSTEVSGLIASVAIPAVLCLAALIYCIRRKGKRKSPQSEHNPQLLNQNGGVSGGVLLSESQAGAEQTSLVTTAAVV